MHIERGEVIADHVHHHADGFGAHDRQPFGFRLGAKRSAIFGGKFAAHGLEIIARI